jgi:hypothetical protein
MTPALRASQGRDFQFRMALYSTRAILHGRGGDVWEMMKENFL